jgi:hypothetical protein
MILYRFRLADFANRVLFTVPDQEHAPQGACYRSGVLFLRPDIT